MSAYRAALSGGMRRALGAPAELGVRIGFYVVILVVFSALWRAAIEERGGNLAGYDFRAMIWYVAAAEGAVIATKPRMIEDIGNDISSGAVAVELLRPVSLVGFRLATELGEAVVRLGGAAVAGAVFVLLVAGAPPHPGAALLSLPAAILGVCCNLALQHTFAGAAFWVDDAKGSWFLYQKLVFLLGGMLLPLELLPDPLAVVARTLPFWTTAYIPGRMLSGHPEFGLLVVQSAWLVLLLGAAAVVFRAGERRLQVAGG